MTRSRSIAVAQTCPVRGDVSANLDEHVCLAKVAATEGAAVVVFPELSLSGYELDLAEELAFAEDDPRLTELHLGFTTVTDAGTAELRAALPKCKITR